MKTFIPQWLATACSVLMLSFTASAQLCDTFHLVETNGSFGPQNVARLPGATPFAKDLLDGWFPYHQIAFLNDGNYGNSNAWVSDSLNSHCGISFPAPQHISSVAFSRDNNGFFSDRSRGTYILQWTSVPNPNEQTADAAWTTIGIVTNAANKALRQRFCFSPVFATGIRMLTQTTEVGGAGGGIAVDELEIISSPVLSIETAAVRLRWFAESNVTYQVQWSTDVQSWSNLTSVVGSGGFTNFVDWTDNTRRFYRLFQQ